MIIAVLDYSSCDVDIITDAPTMNDEQTEEWLISHCQYNPDNIYWMSGNHIRVNNLTPDDFGN